MMSPLPEVLAVQSLEDFRARRSRGEDPKPEEYIGLPRPAYEEFLAILDVDQRLEGLLEPSLDEPLPREFGHYTLLRELGRGAVGIVYEGLDRNLDRRAAVKVLKPGLETEPSVVDRFRRGAI